MGNDVLRVRKMAFFAHHGVLPEEAHLGQRYEVDAEIFGDFGGYSKGVPEGVVDYTQVYEAVASVVTGERYAYVEALADRIAEVLAQRFPSKGLIIRVRKPNPPLPAHFEGIEVEVRRGALA